MTTIEETRVVTTHIVMPPSANVHGTAFGGHIMSWIDIAAAITAAKHCNRPVVTASFDAVHFLQPIKIGQAVTIKSQVNAVFNTSMECGAIVLSEDLLTGEVIKAAKAYATFVALDDDSKPLQAPPIETQDTENLRRMKEAVMRREARLNLRQALLEDQNG